MKNTLLILLVFCTSLCSTLLHAEIPPSKSVAVVVYAVGASPSDKVIARIAQTRVEQVLSDNSVTVLDQEKTQSLKKAWKKLDDPSFLLTAEEVVKAAQQYKIDGIYRVYIKAQSIAAPEQFFTSTAHADIQFVGEDAKVLSVSPPVMGTVGNPPSDGLTESASITNAIQRAVDDALEKAGYKIMDATSPRKLDFELLPVDMTALGKLDQSQAIQRVAVNPNQLPNTYLRKNVEGATSITNEEFTCLAQSPDKAMIATGIRVSVQKRMNIAWKTIMRLFDPAAGKTILEFEVDSGMRHGTTDMLDCTFVNNWRYLTAVTGNSLIMWDTERGTVVSQIDLKDRSLTSAVLTYYRTDHGGFLVVDGNNMKSAYQLVVKRK